MRVDVLAIRGDVVTISIITDQRGVTAEISIFSYRSLQRDGFFLRRRDTMDGMGRINTSREFQPVGEEKDEREAHNFSDELE